MKRHSVSFKEHCFTLSCCFTYSYGSFFQYFMITHMQPNALQQTSPNAGTPCAERTNSKRLCLIFPTRFALLHRNGCLLYCLCWICVVFIQQCLALCQRSYFWNTLRGNSAFFILTFFHLPKINEHRCTLVQEVIIIIFLNIVTYDFVKEAWLGVGEGGDGRGEC